MAGKWALPGSTSALARPMAAYLFFIILFVFNNNNNTIFFLLAILGFFLYDFVNFFSGYFEIFDEFWIFKNELEQKTAENSIFIVKKSPKYHFYTQKRQKYHFHSKKYHFHSKKYHFHSKKHHFHSKNTVIIVKNTPKPPFTFEFGACPSGQPGDRARGGGLKRGVLIGKWAFFWGF
jgi:hypothetical protein